MSETGTLGKLLAFLVRLEGRKMVEVAVPGERWEVEFFDDEHVEIEVFALRGMEDEAALERLFAKDAA